MNDVKTDALPLVKLEAEDPQRRSLAMALFGALGGAALLDACGGESVSQEQMAQSVSAATGYTSSGTGVATSPITWVDTVLTDLRAISMTGAVQGQLFIAKGRNTIGDGGGGIFHWDNTVSGSHPSVDNGTIFNSAVTPMGVFRRVFEPRAVSVKWFGALGDGTDATSAIQAALNSAAVSPAIGGGVVHIPAGNYLISSTLTIPGSRITVRGGGSGDSTTGFATKLFTNSTSLSVLSATNLNCLRIEFIAFVCAVAGSSAIGMTAINVANSTLCGIAITGFAKGLQFTRGSGSSFCNTLVDCRIFSNSSTNVEANSQTNALTVFGGTYGGASQTGIYVNDSNSLTITGADIEGCSVVGVDIDAPAKTQVAAVIHGVHFENKTPNTPSAGSIRIGATNTVDAVSICGCLFSGGPGPTPLNIVNGTNIKFECSFPAPGTYTANPFISTSHLQDSGNGALALFYNDSSTVVKNMMKFMHKNSANVLKTMADVYTRMINNVAGSERASMFFETIEAGVMTPQMQLSNDPSGNPFATFFGSIQSGGSSGPTWQSSGGTPEGSVPGKPGDLYSDTTNGELYIKKSGAGTTTGWKLVTHS